MEMTKNFRLRPADRDILSATPASPNGRHGSLAGRRHQAASAEAFKVSKDPQFAEKVIDVPRQQAPEVGIGSDSARQSVCASDDRYGVSVSHENGTSARACPV